MLAFLPYAASMLLPATLAQLIVGMSDSELALTISGGAILYTVIRWRRNTVIRKNAPASPAKGLVTGSALNMREINEEVQALLGDLEETCRRLTAQLDNRTTRLEQLLAEADDKIRILQGLGGQAGGPLAPAMNGSRPFEPEAQSAAVDAAGHDAQRALSRLRRERGAPAPTDDPAYQPIYAMADGGKSTREIAQQLGRQPGEIELILALRQRAG